jgi:TatA/E family protein of Tat protein translocase
MRRKSEKGRFAYGRSSSSERARAVVVVALQWLIVLSLTAILVAAMAALGFVRFSALKLALLVAIGVILFGKRLPDVGRSLGRSITQLKKGMGGLADDDVL